MVILYDKDDYRGVMNQYSFSLAGKTALVTGGNGGIGLGMAKGLAANGANIVIWGTNEHSCQVNLTLDQNKI